MLERNHFYNMDSIEGMKQIPDKYIDLILCDLPYGVTARNRWDCPINPDQLWEQYRRIIKDTGAIVLFGSGMFTAKMMQAGEDMYRYSLIWEKTEPTGFYNAGRMPLRSHEDIMVFYRKQPAYHPQKTTGHKRKTATARQKQSCERSLCYGTVQKLKDYDSTERFPTSVLKFKTDKQRCNLHPTQKPVALLRWIIRTYTDEGDLVLDNACGSGSTCEAAKEEGRDFIGIDNGICEKERSQYKGMPWVEIAEKRIAGEIDSERIRKSAVNKKIGGRYENRKQ